MTAHGRTATSPAAEAATDAAAPGPGGDDPGGDDRDRRDDREGGGGRDGPDDVAGRAARLPAGSGRSGSWARATARTDRPLIVAALAGLAAVVFVCARLVLVGDGDVSSFMVVGRDYVDPDTTSGLAMSDGTGYDGQFAYRMALDPLHLEGDRNGIEVDSPLRWGRIAYPSLAWLAAGGQPGAVPAALVAVNVAGVALLGWLAALAARARRLHAGWGLLLVGWPGFVFSVSRDLTEVVAAVGVVGGLVAWERRRPGWAATALTVAVLAREGTLVVVAALALVQVVGWVRGRTGPSALDLAWLAPAGLFLAWQAWCGTVTGTVPILASVEDHVAEPSVGTGAEAGWLGEAARHLSVLKGAQFLVLAVALVLAALAVRRRRVEPVLVVALVLAVAVIARVWGPVWNDWASFRGVTDVYVLATLALLAGRRQLGWLALALAPVWAVTAAHMAVAL